MNLLKLIVDFISFILLAKMKKIAKIVSTKQSLNYHILITLFYLQVMFVLLINILIKINNNASNALQIVRDVLMMNYCGVVINYSKSHKILKDKNIFYIIQFQMKFQIQIHFKWNVQIFQYSIEEQKWIPCHL
ncbi:unnamed protein product [Paramecium pentaurelia]|uniref:Transmembrane protein n=1 Tax=Paramecium pentaurelia TaxID=43138 RepID=A0A8S1V8R1_9CILI|nr:unnamed protein product [Paramecium pentaurelia]